MSATVRPALRLWAVCTVLFAGTVLLFSRATGYGFSSYDDPRYVTSNPFVQAGLTGDSVGWAFTAQADYWHPLTWLSHMLDWQLYGDQAGGHHLTSIGWHAINAVLAFLVLRRLTAAFWTSAFGAALFAWHPQRVESVVWITERKDVMSGCFFLLTLWAYAVYAERQRTQRRAWPFYALTLALFAGGLMCKPMLVTVPAVLLLLDFWPLRRFEPAPATGAKPKAAVSPHLWRGLLWEKVPFLLLSAATSVVTILMQRDSGAFVLKLPLDARLGNAAVSVVRYLGGFFWPFDLAIFYPHPGHWPVWAVVGATLLVLGLTVAAWRQRAVRPWQLAGWGWFLVMLLPAIGLVQVGSQAMADRYTYLPILGWQLALLLTVRAWPVRPAARWVPGLLGGALLAGCAARTWNQEALWRNPLALFSHAVAVTERNSVAEGFLGFTFLGLGRLAEAETHSLRALEIDPRNETALFTLASVRDKQGRVGEAVAGYRTLLELNPTDLQTEYVLGVMLLRQNQKTEALRHLQYATAQRPDLLAANLRMGMAETLRNRPGNALPYFEVAVAVSPRDAVAHFGFGLALFALGRTEEALAHYQTAVQLQPDYPEARLEIGQILLNRHEPAEAADHFRTVLASRPKLGLAHLGLGRAAEQLGRTAEATASFEQAIARAPDDPAVQVAWAEVLARRGRFADALPFYARAVQLQPQDAGAHAGLGYMLYLTGRRAEALAQWEEALRLDPNFPGLAARLQKVRAEGN